MEYISCASPVGFFSSFCFFLGGLGGFLFCFLIIDSLVFEILEVRSGQFLKNVNRIHLVAANEQYQSLELPSLLH